MKALPLSLLVATLLCAGPAVADSSKGKAKKAGGAQGSAAEYAPGKGEHGRPAFSPQESAEIRGYFKANPKARGQLPPGLAKKNKIPPGWQKKLARGERIPDDVWSHRVPLPREIDSKLPRLEDGVVRVRIDDRVVRVAERTREVLDVIELAREVTRNSPPR